MPRYGRRPMANPLAREARIASRPPTAPSHSEQLYAVFSNDPVCQGCSHCHGAFDMQSAASMREQGASYSGILRDVRVRRAARAMLDSPASLDEIGYAYGLSGQAHFTCVPRSAQPDGSWNRYDSPLERTEAYLETNRDGFTGPKSMRRHPLFGCVYLFRPKVLNSTRRHPASKISLT